jgi:glycogen synthase
MTGRRGFDHARTWLMGILNGVDYSAWSPDKDKLIP